MGSNVLRRSLDIDAPPNDVWRVLTTPELVCEWAAAYEAGLSIRTSWREGAPFTWKTPAGVSASGHIAAIEPERLLRFDYPADPGGEIPARMDTFEICFADHGSRLEFTMGPLAAAQLAALEGPATQAIEEIKSLAEESAEIRRRR